ncbi:MAG: 2TM domain-containing protein [Alphaproteobacteria bacterium]
MSKEHDGETQMNEQELRKRVRALREFYQSLIIYGLVNAGLVLVWAVSGGGYFWPIWVMVGWGLGLGVSALSLGLLPQLSSLFPVFSEDWEEAQLQKMRRQQSTKTQENNTIILPAELPEKPAPKRQQKNDESKSA